MDKQNLFIVLGTAHRMREPGKESPDKRLKECVYSREICSRIASELKNRSYQVEIDYEPLDLPSYLQTMTVKQERNNELNMRIRKVNDLCVKHKGQKVIYVSVHVNAVGCDGKWHDARGWQVNVSPKASTNSKLLAGYLFDAAKSYGLKMRQPLPTQKYWSQSLYVLNNTKCPAVLTENLFQDNQTDVDFLLSERGKQTIVDIHVKGIESFAKSV